jgi:tetrapyrrole methylase family protein/MazG family protein
MNTPPENPVDLEIDAHAREAGEEFARLVALMSRLRAPDGCPWDREQTHQSLRKYLLEESYEVLAAIESGDDGNFCEELGDLLLQPVFHAQLAHEESRFSIADALRAINGKLVRRHPHVFGTVQADDSAQVLANWDAIKKSEKQSRSTGADSESILDGVPRAQPSLSLAHEISKRAAKEGFEWPDEAGVLDKLREEVRELEEALEGGNSERIGEEIGDALFTLVNIARWRKVDAELALRDMVARFSGRFRDMEVLAREENLGLRELDANGWDALWNRAKAREKEA